MPVVARHIGYTAGAGGQCTDLNFNADLLDTALTNAQVLSQGFLTLTQISGSTFTTTMPWFSNFVKTGLTLSLQLAPNANKVDYLAGTYQINALGYSIGVGGTITLTAGDPVLQREDIIYLTTSNTIVYLAGTPATPAVAPTPPANSLVIAHVGVDPLASGAGGFTLTLVNFNGSFGGSTIPNGSLDTQTLYWSSAANAWKLNSIFKSNAVNTRIGSGSVATGVNDEVLQVNSRIQLYDTSAPAVTTNKMYAVGGELYWNTYQLTPPVGSLSPGTVTNSTLRWNGATWIENTRFLTFDVANNFGAGTTATTFGAGTGNLCYGPNTFTALTNGVNNIALGDSALKLLTTGSRNIGIGLNALIGCTSASDNVAIGYNVMSNNTLATDCVVIGSNAGQLIAGPKNVVIGSNAGSAMVGGGTENILFGYNAGNSLTTGARNIAIGSDTLIPPTAVNCIAIGKGAVCNTSSQIIIGSNNCNYNVMYWGRGKESTAIEHVSIASTERAGIADTAGNNFSIVAGSSTGSALGGAVQFRTSNAGAAGTTKNIQTLKAEITPNTFIKYVGEAVKYATVTISSTINVNTEVYLVNTAIAITLTLPTTGLVDGQTWVIKDSTGNATVNNITLDPTGAVLIDGAATFKIASNWGSCKIMWSQSANKYFVIL